VKISILNVGHTVFEGFVSEAILPSADGELSIYDDHETIFVALNKGTIRLKSLVETAEQIKPIAIRQGLARMKNNELVILVE
jgi:F0F1-type ATP synthase epsilon subunit